MLPLLLFIVALFEQTYNICLYYSSSTLLLSSWLSLGRGPPLGCRAKIWTQAFLTASRGSTVWATPHLNPNPHTVPCIPNRYGKQGVCAGLSPSPIPSTRRPISHWWARWVSVACLSHVLWGGGWAGQGGGRERRKRASYPVNRAYTH
jgi:hypothetical protein